MTRNILNLLCAGSLLLGACSNNRESGTSTPIDSTVRSGTAPVNYQAGMPDNTTDTSIRQRDAMRGDTMGQRTSAPNQPNGNGTNSSNTTDKRTTSGSSANGDADGDRKR